MIPLSVSEISALGGFCDKQQQQHEQEWGILVVGWVVVLLVLVAGICKKNLGRYCSSLRGF